MELVRPELLTRTTCDESREIDIPIVNVRKWTLSTEYAFSDHGGNGGLGELERKLGKWCRLGISKPTKWSEDFRQRITESRELGWTVTKYNWLLSTRSRWYTWEEDLRPVLLVDLKQHPTNGTVTILLEKRISEFAPLFCKSQRWKKEFTLFTLIDYPIDIRTMDSTLPWNVQRAPSPWCRINKGKSKT